jgi:hypothetical protein
LTFQFALHDFRISTTLTDSNDVEVQVNTLGNELAVSEVWNPIMASARNFYQTFPNHDSESEENAMRKSIAMCDRTNTMAGDRQKRSIYKMKLPFSVDPSVKRIRFLGTKDGQRYATVDLATGTIPVHWTSKMECEKQQASNCT